MKATAAGMEAGTVQAMFGQVELALLDQAALAEERANYVVLQARLAERNESLRMLRPALDGAPDADGSPSSLTTSG